MDELEKDIKAGLGKAALDLLDRAYTYAVSKAGVYRDVAKLTFINGFVEYISQSEARFKKVKTIISRSAPVDLRRAYVPMRFECGRRSVEEIELRALLYDGGQIVINGRAGSGKSMTMRSIFLDLLAEEKCIPVLIELREVDISAGSGLASHICSQIAVFTGGFSEEGLIYGVKNGHIALLLDGFDEVDPKSRGEMEAQILELVARCPRGGVVVSGRPDERYNVWPTFNVFTVAGLGKDQAI